MTKTCVKNCLEKSPINGIRLCICQGCWEDCSGTEINLRTYEDLCIRSLFDAVCCLSHSWDCSTDLITSQFHWDKPAVSGCHEQHFSFKTVNIEIRQLCSTVSRLFLMSDCRHWCNRRCLLMSTVVFSHCRLSTLWQVTHLSSLAGNRETSYQSLLSSNKTIYSIL